MIAYLRTTMCDELVNWNKANKLRQQTQHWILKRQLALNFSVVECVYRQFLALRIQRKLKYLTLYETLNVRNSVDTLFASLLVTVSSDGGSLGHILAASNESDMQNDELIHLSSFCLN